MRTLRAAALGAACGLATAGSALAQSGLAQPAAIGGAAPAVYHGPAANPLQGPPARRGDLVDAHGDPAVIPSSFAGPASYGGGYCGPTADCGPYGAGGYCPPDGGCYGGAAGGPFGGAYMNTDQCGPHYFDISAEYLYYSRDDNAVNENTLFSTLGFANDADVQNNTYPLAQQALRGSDLDQEDGDGYRLTGRIDVGALSVAEFTYSDIEWSSRAFATNDGSTQLFSIYSLYGSATNGPFGVGGSAGPIPTPVPTDAPFEETTNANRHVLDYDSSLQTAEASFRRYWVGYSPRVSGTVLIGFRYTNLSEMLGFYSFADVTTDVGPPPTVVPKSIAVVADADNDLAGIQVGGDAWLTVCQGVRIGAEGKLGLFNNDYNLRRRIAASDGTPSSDEMIDSGDQVAFLTEGKISVVADIAPSWSLKGGYELLYITDLALMNDAVALAQPYGDINNISAQAPIQALRAPTTDGDVFYHGFHVGLEYIY